MKIAVDLDDTMNDLLRSLLLFHNHNYGTNFKEEEFITPLYREIWGGTHEEEVEKLKKFFVSDFFQNVKPAPYSVEVINILKEYGHDLSIITGRIYSLKEQTEEFIGRYFPNIFSGIYHTNSYGLSGKKIKKSEMCKQIGADIIIDDDMLHVNDCASEGIPVIVFSQPWNRCVLPCGCVSVSSWKDIPSVINKIALNIAM